MQGGLRSAGVGAANNGSQRELGELLMHISQAQISQKWEANICQRLTT
jgi:hypothetical protein